MSMSDFIINHLKDLKTMLEDAKLTAEEMLNHINDINHIKVMGDLLTTEEEAKNEAENDLSK